jgi:hypothetical protein
MQSLHACKKNDRFDDSMAKEAISNIFLELDGSGDPRLGAGQGQGEILESCSALDSAR